MSKALNRAAVYATGLHARFDLPVFEGAAYSPAYVAFLRGVVALRTFDISEETPRDLWHLEKKLLQLLHVDSAGSRTRFLDSCGATTHQERRLLLTNHEAKWGNYRTQRVIIEIYDALAEAMRAGFLTAVR